MHPGEFRKVCDEILQEGLESLSLSMGIVSHIDKEDYEIIAVISEAGVFVPGECFPLSDTFCRDVVTKKSTIALTEYDGEAGLNRHPLYKNIPLEAYISAPIILNGKVWGTLNFSSMKKRDHPFTSVDIEYVESSAQRISNLWS